MERFDPKIKIDQQNNITIIFYKRLDTDTVTKIWYLCLDLLPKHHPPILNLDLDQVEYCDGAGIALLLELKHQQIKHGREVTLTGLTPWLQKILKIVENSTPIEESQQNLDIATRVGILTVKIWDNVQENIVFIGLLIVQLIHTLFRPQTLRWRDFWRVVEETGPNALPLITMIGFLVGLISTFQGASPLARFGAQIYLANLVGLGLVREMGPLMTAVLLAGRTASSFAAELGTMKVDREIDALTTMGLEPVKFLAIPRLLAVTLMSPLLSIFLIFFGLVGCGLVMQSLGYNLDIYLNQLHSAISMKDFLSGLIKTIVFGMVIASVGCLHGLKTRYGPSAVGYSTTQAVVSSITMIVVVDGIFASLYYVFGI